jgi:hypothetical protein
MTSCCVDSELIGPSPPPAHLHHAMAASATPKQAGCAKIDALFAWFRLRIIAHNPNSFASATGVSALLASSFSRCLIASVA